MITEDYVSFETAKLLKEKEFDENTNCYYIEGSVDKNLCYSPIRQNHNKKITNNEFDINIDITSSKISAPTLQMAMKWLREVHNLHCDIGYDDLDWFWNILNVSESVPVEERPMVIKNGFAGFKNYEEACEAAVKYCLKNLIKNEDEEESDIAVPKTVEEAISMLEKILSDEDREYLLKNGAISMHNSLGRWIRNEWGLWADSELKNELKKKGFEHPDDMSNYIIEEFIKYWNNKL